MQKADNTSGVNNIYFIRSKLAIKVSFIPMKYNNAIYKLDKLKADITTLRDNGYPFNAMIERTLSDIDARNQVITRLVKKYQK